MSTPRNARKGAKDATAADSGTHGGSRAREAHSEDARLGRYGEAIWTTSKRDEGTISVTGANVVARAVMAVADAEQAELRAELAKAKRGAKTLCEIIDKQCCMVLDVTGLHDWVDEDGDGDWGAIWDHLFTLRERAEAAEAERDRLAETLSVHHVEWGVKRPEPYVGVITDNLTREGAERKSQSIQAERSGVWPVVTRTLYVTEWAEVDDE